MIGGLKLHENNDIPQKENIKETKSAWFEIYEWVECAVATVVAIILIFTFVFKQVEVDGTSMNDTLLDNERVLISNVFYKPQYGDIVVISSEVYGDVPLIKRVIATEGQWINIHDGVVYVGDTKETMIPKGDEFTSHLRTESVVSDELGFYEYPLQVPDGAVFVLGDNRSISLDSRTQAVGFIDTNQILGKALYRVYPFEKIGSIYN